MGNFLSKRNVLITGLSTIAISIIFYINQILNRNKPLQKDQLQVKEISKNLDQILINKMKTGTKMRITIVTNEVSFIFI